MKTPQMVRSDMPFLNKLVYLDSASVCPTPKPVVEAMNEYFMECPLNYGVGEFEASILAASKVDGARVKLASFVNAESSKNIVFTKNTTEAINLVANGLDWQAGDEIILTSVEHQSNLMPWLRQAETQGIKVVMAQAEPSGLVNPDSIAKLITSKTRLVDVTHVSNIYGTIQPVKEIGKIVKQAGALFMVDAAQSGGRIKIDVQDIGCDFLAICGRKSIMGPQGTGALYAKEELLERLTPLVFGSRAGHVMTDLSYTLNAAPKRFESGVLNTSGVIGLGAATDYIESIGYNNIIKYIRQLTQQMIDVLLSHKEIQLYGCTDVAYLAGILSWNVKGMTDSEVATKLDKVKKVAVASGAQGSLNSIKPHGVKSVVRSSVHYFTLPEDIQALDEALKVIL